MCSTIANCILLVFMLHITVLKADNEICPDAKLNHSIFDVDVIRYCDGNFLQFQFKISESSFTRGKYILVVDTRDFYCVPQHVESTNFALTIDLNDLGFNKVVIPYNTSSQFVLYRNCVYNICMFDRKRRSMYGLQYHLQDFYFKQPIKRDCLLNNCICDANKILIENVSLDETIVKVKWSNFEELYHLMDFAYLTGCDDNSYKEVTGRKINNSIVEYHVEHFIANTNGCLTVIFAKDCGCYVFKLLRIDKLIPSKDDKNTKKSLSIEMEFDKMDIAKSSIVILGALSITIFILYKITNAFKHLVKNRSLEKIEKLPKLSLRKKNINFHGHHNLDPYEISKNCIQLSSEIGTGAFGQVFSARMLLKGVRMHVAVKTLKDRATPEEMDEFLGEIDVMKRIGQHGNIVRMLRCCTLSQPYMMVMEYVPFGDLKNYLLDLRGEWNKDRCKKADSVVSDDYITPGGNTTEDPDILEYSTEKLLSQDDIQHVLDHRELQNFAHQIAKGMSHLEKLSVVHRDLAARNILINERKVLKISDFGLSRAGQYMTNNLKKLPLRWMAIEAIEDHFYDSKSDVWSFAVVLWEIGTLGGFPYEEIADNMVVYHILNGGRLQRPVICTDELYSLMLRCWMKEASLRPTFQELEGLLDVKTKRVYIDFSQLNPSYVFPPGEQTIKL